MTKEIMKRNRMLKSLNIVSIDSKKLHELSSTKHATLYADVPSYQQLHPIAVPHSELPFVSSLPFQYNCYNNSHNTSSIYNYPGTDLSVPSDQQHSHKNQKSNNSFFTNLSSNIHYTDSTDYHYSNDNLSMSVLQYINFCELLLYFIIKIYTIFILVIFIFIFI